MTFDAVRTAVLAWIKNSAPGITTYYRSMPSRIDAKKVFQGLGSGNGAAAIVHIAQSEEHREAITRLSWKRVTYSVEVYVLYRQIPTGRKPGFEDPAEEGQQKIDGIIDALKARLHLDPTLGGTVFSAGEGGEQRAPDLHTVAGIPILDEEGTAIHTWTQLHMIVTEFIRA